MGRGTESEGYMHLLASGRCWGVEVERGSGAQLPSSTRVLNVWEGQGGTASGPQAVAGMLGEWQGAQLPLALRQVLGCAAGRDRGVQVPQGGCWGFGEGQGGTAALRQVLGCWGRGRGVHVKRKETM